jgi:hypothetical protein
MPSQLSLVLIIALGNADYQEEFLREALLSECEAFHPILRQALRYGRPQKQLQLCVGLTGPSVHLVKPSKSRAGISTSAPLRSTGCEGKRC